MFGKIVALIFLTCGVWTSCARPKYVEDSSPNQNSAGKIEAAAECTTTFSESQYCLNWYWETPPTSTRAGSLIFKVYRLNHFDKTPVVVDSALTPEVVLWMPSMGHGSTPTQTTRLDVGTYRVSNVFFIMPGEWDIRFIIKADGDASKTADSARVAISI